MPKEAPLTIEKFYGDEEQKFLIASGTEIRRILHEAAQEKSRAILYFDRGKQFIQTRIVGVDAEGVWLDAGPDESFNRPLLNSRDLVLVSLHQQAKIQFEGGHIRLATHADKPAFHMPVPGKLLRLQRRDYFRLAIPPDAAPLKCVVPVQGHETAAAGEVTIMDISVGGVALVCEEHTVHLEEGQIYPDCRIELPGIGILKVTIQVRNVFELADKQGLATRHAGCEFMNLNGQMSMLLQRYIAQMQHNVTATAQQKI
ncbi:MAG TPA: flagellar brake protein [Gallionellaceae bacterium]